MIGVLMLKGFGGSKVSEYVPSTEQVRKDYLKHAALYQDAAADWFDAWLEQVKADAWDEGRNAFPVVYGKDHDVYCSEYECHCDSYTNPYRQGETK